MTSMERQSARREQMLRELASDLADMVANGDMTEQEANEWYNDKAEQWAAEDRAAQKHHVPFVDICQETAYGTTQRLSFQIRVF